MGWGSDRGPSGPAPGRRLEGVKMPASSGSMAVDRLNVAGAKMADTRARLGMAMPKLAMPTVQYRPYSGPGYVPDMKGAARIVGAAGNDNTAELQKSVLRAQNTVEANYQAGKIDDDGYKSAMDRLERIGNDGKIDDFDDAVALKHNDPESPDTSSALDTVANAGGDFVGRTLELASRPGQAILAATGEGARQGANDPTGPFEIPHNPWDMASRGFDAFLSGGDEHDTPTGIMRDVGNIRAKRGDSTKLGGFVPGTDLRTDPLGEYADPTKLLPLIPFGAEIKDHVDDWISEDTKRTLRNVGVDLTVAVATDPLTYVSFGTSAVAKAGLRGVERLYGAEKAVEVARDGLKALSAAERAGLAESVPAKVMHALEEGARGGVKLRVPFRGGEGHLLGEGRTLIPGKVFSDPAKALVRGVDKTPGLSKVADGLRAARRAFKPRQEIKTALGSEVERLVDTARVATGEGAAGLSQVAIDKLVHASRTARVTDPEKRVLMHALESDARATLEPRLQAVYDVADEIRRGQYDRAVASGGMLSAEHMQDVLDAGVAKAEAKLGTLEAKHAKVTGRRDAKLAALTPAEPHLQGATGAVERAFYAGGKVDERLGAAQRAATAGTAPEQAAVARAVERAGDVPGPGTVALPSTVGVDAAGRGVERAAVGVDRAAGKSKRLLGEVSTRNTAEVAKREARRVELAKEGDRIQARYTKAVDRLHELSVNPPTRPWTRAEIKSGIRKMRQVERDALRHQRISLELDLSTGLAKTGGIATGTNKRHGEYDMAMQVRAAIGGGQDARFKNLTFQHYDGGTQRLFKRGKSNIDVVLDTIVRNQVEAGYHVADVDEALEWLITTVKEIKELRGAEQAVITIGLPDRLAMARSLHQEDYISLAGDIDEATDMMMEIANEGRTAASATSGAREVSSLSKEIDRIEMRLGVIDAAERALPTVGKADRLSELEVKVAAALDDDLRAAGLSSEATKLRGGGYKALDGEARKFYDALVVDAGVAVKAGRVTDARAALAETAKELAGRAADRGFQLGKVAGRADQQVTTAQRLLADAERAGRQAGARVPTLGAEASRVAGRADTAQDALGAATERLSGQSFARGGKAGVIGEREGARLAKLDDKIAEATAKLEAVKASAEAGVRPVERYMPRVLTPKGDKYEVLGREAPPTPTGSLTGAGKDRFLNERIPWVDFETGRPAETIDEINDLMGKRLGGDGERYFMDDPFVALATREVAGRQAQAARAFWHDLIAVADKDGSRVAMTLEEAGVKFPKGFDAAERQRVIDRAVGPGFVEMTLPKMGLDTGLPRQIVVRAEIATELGRYAHLMGTPTEIAKLSRFLESWQQLWKGYATVPIPFSMGFHMRNAGGNLLLNWLAGVRDFRDYTTATRIQRAMKDGIQESGDMFSKLNAADRALAEAAVERGVIGEGFFSVDLAQPGELASTLGQRTIRFRDRADKGRRLRELTNPLNAQNALIAPGRRFGKAIEDNARLANFSYFARTTGDFDFSAQQVRKWLFDYGDLSPADKMLRKVIPFWTFTRKSAPVVLEGFAKNPYKLARIQEARRALAGNAGPIDGPYPRFLAQSMGTPLPFTPPGFNGDQAAIWTPDLPIQAPIRNIQSLYEIARQAPILNNLPATGMKRDEALNNLMQLPGGGPLGLASAAAQVSLGSQFFNGAPLSGGYRPASPLASALGLSEDRYVKDPDTGELVLMDANTDNSQFMAEQLFPLLPKIGGFPGLSTPGKEDRVPRRMLGTATGLKVYPLTVQEQSNERQRLLDEVDVLLKELKSQYGVTR